MKRALYIGRFQLFHKGHLDVIQHIDKTEDIGEIIIAIGSSQYDHKNKSPVAPWNVNPFTYEERKRMVSESLEGKVQKPYLICPIPDFHNWPKWKKYVCDTLPEFHVLYTIDKREKKEFSEIGYEVREFPIKYNYHAGIIRERMYKGIDWWSGLTPETLKIIKEIKGVERVRELFSKDIAGDIKKMIGVEHET